jgi:hypothetical protein
MQTMFVDPHKVAAASAGKALVDDDCAKKSVTELTRDWTTTSPPTAVPTEKPPQVSPGVDGNCSFWLTLVWR